MGRTWEGSHSCSLLGGWRLEPCLSALVCFAWRLPLKLSSWEPGSHFCSLTAIGPRAALLFARRNSCGPLGLGGWPGPHHPLPPALSLQPRVCVLA